MPLQSIQFYMGMILIRFQFLINVNSISIISWVLLSISITISITKTGPYQYQYIINFSKFFLSISMPISILHLFLINISLSMHCATLVYGTFSRVFCASFYLDLNKKWKLKNAIRWMNFQPKILSLPNNTKFTCYKAYYTSNYWVFNENSA